MRERRVVLTGLALVLALAGCGAPSATPGSAGGPGTGGDIAADPDGSIAVDASDGLNRTELNRTVARAAARLEVLRGLEFDRPVRVRVINRTEYRESQPFGSSGVDAAWNDQIWEGLLLVGEDRNVTRVFETTLGSAVQGYYTPGSGEIVIVTDGEQARIDRGTLVHELVHALQDQRFGLDAAPRTQDRQLARNAVVEGEAVAIERRYQRRCSEEWDCIETPPSRGAGSGDVDRGLLGVIRYPYIVGPEFVAAIQRRGGRAAVNDLYGAYPTSTEQVTHPSRYPDDTPRNVTVSDRSEGDWRRFDHDPVGDTVGQASLFVALGEAGALDGAGSYTHPAVEGWEGDRLVPYRNGDRRGYVWELAWESPADARAFVGAYRDALDGMGARRDGAVHVVPESSPFGDAFRVVQAGSRVRIVNAPTVGELAAVHRPET